MVSDQNVLNLCLRITSNKMCCDDFNNSTKEFVITVSVHTYDVDQDNVVIIPEKLNRLLQLV